jgi:hypothetical protein
VCLVVALHDAGVSYTRSHSEPIPGNATIQSFNKAKKLMRQVFAGHEHTFFLPKRGASDPFTSLLPSQESLVAGAGFTRFLLLAEREMPRLAA